MNLINFLPKKIKDYPLYVDFCDIYQYAFDKYANFDDIKKKYRDILTLNEDAVRAVVDEFGFGYVLDVFELSQGVLDVNTVLGFLSAIHALKGHRSGLELVFQLFGLKYTLLEWWEIDPVTHSHIWDEIVTSNTIDFWTADTPYEVWDMIIPPTPNDHKYICVVAGTSDSSEPGWLTGENESFTDGGVTWAEFGRDWGENVALNRQMPPDVFALEVEFSEEDYGSSDDFIASITEIIARLKVFVRNYVYPILAVLNWTTIWAEDWYPNWQPDTEYALGDVILPSYPNENSHGYLCLTSGKSGLVEPVWPTDSEDIVLDNTITWMEYGKSLWDEYLDELVVDSPDYSTIWYHTWESTTLYAEGDFLIPTDDNDNGHAFICTTGGISGGTEPIWPDSGSVGDGSAVWEEYCLREDFNQTGDQTYIIEDQVFAPGCITNCDECSTNDAHVLSIDAAYPFRTAGLIQPWDTWEDTITP